MATTTLHKIPSAGSYVAHGTTTSLDDAGTVDTGLLKVDGMLITTATADCVATSSSQSAGVATIALKTAGAAATGITIYWEAWQLTRSG